MSREYVSLMGGELWMEPADVPCTECDGTGTFEHPHSRPELEMIWPCTTCGGTGLIGPESIFYDFARKQFEGDMGK